MSWDEKLLKQAKKIIKLYPQKRSALGTLLHLAQSKDGYISDDSISVISDLVGITEVQVKPSYGISDSEIEKMLRDSFSNAKEDIEMRNLRESMVEAERVILSINSALKIDGKDLLNENEYNEICNARDNLIDNLKSNKRENIINSVKDLESISETYISRRMNSSIQKIMKGKDVKEYK